MTEHFKCFKCGKCCEWEGYVHISAKEIEKIAEYLGLTVEDFNERYSRLTSDRKGLSLKEHEDGSCIFYNRTKKTCDINPVKPEQCRVFPLKWNFPGWDELCEWGIHQNRNQDFRGE